jgi:hypothetical protein
LQARIKDVIEKKFEVTVEKVVQELAAIAFANVGDYYEWGPYETDNRNGSFVHVKLSHQLSRTQKAAIVGVEVSFTKAGDPLVSVQAILRLDRVHHPGAFAPRSTGARCNAGPATRMCVGRQLAALVGASKFRAQGFELFESLVGLHFTQVRRAELLHDRAATGAPCARLFD